MVACPDFAAGAMENWGLITYREVALLCDNVTASVRQKRYIAIVVCHELAHQWFGNLVTMDWWSQLWLNEGFACFMEYLSSQAVFEDWPMWNLFITSEYSRAFELDGMDTSHAIECDVKTVHEAEEVFDAISYCKGAAVIRMLQQYLGDKVFQNALEKYLNHFKYSNATTNDLWRFLANESNKPVATIMRGWTRQQGFPLITAKRNGNKLILRQNRYLSSGNSEESESKSLWNVPLQLRVSTSDNTIPILLEKREQEFDLPKNCEWVHLNGDSTGFYCCSYDSSMMKALSEALSKNDKRLTVIDKVCLVRDTNALATSGAEGSTQNLLTLLTSFKSDVTHPVWDAIISGAGEISHLIDSDKSTMDLFSKIMRDAMAPLFKSIGFE